MALDKEDCVCPICMCIFIEPVTMPCKHSLCMQCYKETVDKANLCCPICRLRISVWARKATKMNCLIDKVKWDAVQKSFPEEVQNRLEGKDSQDDAVDDICDFETMQRRLKELSKPGEIRQEYEAALQKLNHQREEQAKAEEKASEILIKTLQLEEEKELEEFEKQKNEMDSTDRVIAEELQEQFYSDYGVCTNTLHDLEATVKPSAVASPHNNREKGITKGKKGKNKHLAANNNTTLMTYFSPVTYGTCAPSSSQGIIHHKEEMLNHPSGYSSDSSHSFDNCPDTNSQSSSPHASTSHEGNFFTQQPVKTYSRQRNPLTTIASQLGKNITETGKLNKEVLVLKQVRESTDRNSSCNSGLKNILTEAVSVTKTDAIGPVSVSDRISNQKKDLLKTESGHSILTYKEILSESHKKQENSCAHSQISNQLKKSLEEVSSSTEFRCVQQQNIDKLGKVTNKINNHQSQNPDTKGSCSFLNHSFTQRFTFGKGSEINANCRRIAQKSDNLLNQTSPETNNLLQKLDISAGANKCDFSGDRKFFFTAGLNEKTSLSQTKYECYGKMSAFTDNIDSKENYNVQNKVIEDNVASLLAVVKNNTENISSVNKDTERNVCSVFRNDRNITLNMRSIESSKAQVDVIGFSSKGMAENGNREMRSNNSGINCNDIKVDRKEPDEAITSLDDNVCCSLNVSNIKQDSELNVTNNSNAICHSSDLYPVVLSGDNVDEFPSNPLENTIYNEGINVSIFKAGSSTTHRKDSKENQNNSFTFNSNQHKDIVKTSTFQKNNLNSLPNNRLKTKNKNSKTQRQSKRLAPSIAESKHSSTSVVSIKRWCIVESDFKQKSRSGNKSFLKTTPIHLKDKSSVEEIDENKKKQSQRCSERKRKLQCNLEQCKIGAVTANPKRSRKDHIDESSSIKPKTSSNIDNSSTVIDFKPFEASCSRNSDHDEMSQEDKDHELALRLQNIYATLDRNRITIDRFKGSKDQYQFRRKGK